ncbi:MAG: hypothetical protein FWG04_04680 [Desulfovibrionaceae bacterium]|nr:hypothetical protein [Desulfovibrionaceae bacterium]
MGGGGKGAASVPAAPVPAEPPKPFQQEREVSDTAQSAREAQLKKARAALGQEGSVLTSPFGSQEQQNEQQRKSLLGG